MKFSTKPCVLIWVLLFFLLVLPSMISGLAGSKAWAADDPIESELDEWGDEDAGPVPRVADPIWPWNKAMFHFNDKLYFWVLKPVAQGYAFVVPETPRRGVKNFFTNIAAPIRVVNSVLQGKPNRASVEVGRFFINILEGGLGFGNAADNYPELASSPEDFGQTLGRYRIGNGFYIIWPVLGPSTLRDSVGLAGDFFLDPVNYLDSWELRLGVHAYDNLNNVSLRIGDYEALKAAAISPYDALKDAYIQNRHKLVNE